MMKVMMLALGGAAGTVMRYFISGVTYRAAGSVFPWGTLAVNLSGSFLIGLLWALFETSRVSPTARTFALAGVLGGYTTFSTFSIETFNLLRDGELGYAALNVFASTIAGLALAYAGFIAGKIIAGRLS